MTAKEKIIEGILAGARTKADDIVKEAEIKAEEEKNAACEAANKEAAAIIAEAQKKADAVIANAHSSAALLKRDTLLKFRSEFINGILESSVQALNSYPDKEYFEFLLALANKNRLSQSGVMYLSAKDAKRDKSVLCGGLAPLGLTLSDEPQDISGGFILQYGDILINCSFESLIREKREKIIDAIAKEL